MSDLDRPFPIMGDDEIKSVPWVVAEICRGQLMRNHGQTVERLAVRGGLGVDELAGALTGRCWGQLRELNVRQSRAVIRMRIRTREE